jgi:hypothetical protein
MPAFLLIGGVQYACATRAIHLTGHRAEGGGRGLTRESLLCSLDREGAGQTSVGRQLAGRRAYVKSRRIISHCIYHEILKPPQICIRPVEFTLLSFIALRRKEFFLFSTTHEYIRKCQHLLLMPPNPFCWITAPSAPCLVPKFSAKYSLLSSMKVGLG